MEVFGRYAGHTALRAGVAADADAILIPEVPVDFDELYAHCKQRFIGRVSRSDVKAGTYLILVAEGLKNANGEQLIDKNAGVDAFGHGRLTGAGRFVCNELTKRFEGDPEIVKFMKDEKMFVKDLYEIPEIRSVAPGHLVRCGHSSVYDVNFGKEVGAAAVTLLQSGLSGVTVCGIQDGIIQYIETQKAIKQRYVDMNAVALHEQLGTSFGRKPQKIVLKSEQMKGPLTRLM